MLHPLKQQVRAVRRRAYRLVLVRGLGWWAALTLFVAFLVGLADYLVRFPDVGARACALAVVASFLAATFWRVVLPVLRHRTSDLQVAQLIERRFPQLQDRLSSSLAFLGEPSDKPAMGSAALQESVIAETDRLVATLNVFDCLEGHGARRAVGVLTLVAATMCVICAFDLPAARMASQRLLLPWSNAAWPRRNQLEFVDPPRMLATGSDFEVALIDRGGHLPATATLEVKFAAESELRTRLIRRVNGQMMARLENVTRGLEFRAVGGDDDTMAWHALEVRDPVQVTDVHISVQPPKYTGLPPRNASRLIRAWAGSKIRLNADLSAPAETVAIDSNFAIRLNAQLAPDGRSLQIPPTASAPWIPTESGIFHFRIKDRGGLEVTSDLSVDLTILEDSPPTVSLEMPTENASFLSGADVPVRAIVKDDLAVRSASLIYQDQSWPLFQEPEADEHSKPTALRPDGDQRVIDTVWKLDSLGLQPGDVIEFHVIAEDGKPQTGTSGDVHLTIISAEDFDNRMDRDQAEFRRRIEKALTLQLGVQSHTELLATSTDWSSATPDSDSLQAAHWGQQQIRQLVGGTDGVLPLAEKLLRRLAINHANRPDVAARLQTVALQLRELDADTLPAIEHQVGSAWKIAQTRGLAPTTQELTQSQAALRLAQQDQQHVIEVLEAILRQFAKWSSVRQIADDAADMQRQQEQLIDDTGALNTVGKAPDDLTAEETALLQQLVQRQAQLARQADRLLLELEKLHHQATSENPAFAEMLRRAFEAAKQSDVAAAAHEARRSLAANRIGSAESQQREVQAGLRKILDAIARRTPDSAATLLASVQVWIVRQQTLISATSELTGPGVDPPGTVARRQITRDLAARQEALAVEIAAAAQPQSSPVVRFMLGDASRLMTAAASDLAREEAGATAQDLQQAAQSRLHRLADALQSASRTPMDAAAPRGDPAGQQPDPQAADQRVGIADLQLLRQLQLEINQRTAEIEQARDDEGLLSAKHRAQLAEIEGRQERLVNLVFALLGEQPPPTTPSHPTGPADPKPSAQPKSGSDLDDALRKANIPGFSED